MEKSLRDYQEPHFQRLLVSLSKYGAALDASDTGTGKTYVALAICKKLGVIPLVIGPKTARAGWEKASALLGVDLEFVNYEKLKGKRQKVLLHEKRARLEDGSVIVFKGPFIEKLANTEWGREVKIGKGSRWVWHNDYGLIIFDEAHRCGGATSLNSKLMIAAKRQAEMTMALSATAADDPRQMKALGYLLGLHGLSKKEPPSRLNYMSWLMRHGCTPGTFGGFDFSSNSEKQKKAFARLHNEIFPSRGSRMRKAEIPGFPETIIDVKLLTDETGKAKKITEELHGLDGEKSPDLASIIHCRQQLEILKIPHFLDLAEDFALTSKIATFVNFTDPLFQLVEALKKKFGNDRVGYISGTQTGKQGEAERWRYLELFQANKLEALVCNAQAGGESANMHDPTGQVERTALISPCESGRQYKQILGRVHRDGGARSMQLTTFFKDTYEEDVADRLVQKNFNLDLLNDADLLI